MASNKRTPTLRRPTLEMMGIIRSPSGRKPTPEMKTFGFVTRVFKNTHGRELAAVYVPTTPNPTGGYLEIVPVEDLIATDWSVDQAMAFIISGGAIGPESLPSGSHPDDGNMQLPPAN